MNIDLNQIKLPETSLKATIEFRNREDASKFASEYTRKTMMGHTFNKNTVTVYNVTEEIKEWIDLYVSNQNKTDEQLLRELGL